MSNTITELPVERNDIGYWSHPAFEALIGDREGISSSEFDAWLQANNLEDAYSYWGEEDSKEYLEYAESGSFAKWQPTPPAGLGWFICSIHETEDDGPICIWLRKLPVVGGE